MTTLRRSPAINISERDRLSHSKSSILKISLVIPWQSGGADSTDTVELDEKWGILLCGLIDAHVYLTRLDDLHRLAKAGVTTAFDMDSWPPSVTNSLRNQPGLTDIRSAGTLLTCPGSRYRHLPGFHTNALIAEAGYAVDFVMLQAAEGPDSIKIIVDVPGPGPGPGPDRATLNVAVAEAKKYGKLTVAHATAYEPVSMARKSKVHILD